MTQQHKWAATVTIQTGHEIVLALFLTKDEATRFAREFKDESGQEIHVLEITVLSDERV